MDSSGLRSLRAMRCLMCEALPSDQVLIRLGYEKSSRHTEYLCAILLHDGGYVFVYFLLLE